MAEMSVFVRLECSSYKTELPFTDVENPQIDSCVNVTLMV